MSKILKIAFFSAVLTGCVASFAKDLAQEKGIICAGFYDNVLALQDSHNDIRMMGAKKFKYMMDNINTYQNKMGVSEESLNSATTRAKDIDLAPLKLFYADLKSKIESGKMSDSEVPSLLLNYFKAREKKLGCK